MDSERVTGSEAETEDAARNLALRLAATDVVYLRGDLGAGKTCFVRGLAGGLGASARQVASPTFSILHEYAGRGGEIVLRHLDLYRIADREAELESLGLPEVVAGAPVAVEWPGDAIRRVLPATIEVQIEVRPSDARRIVIRDL